MWETWVRSLGWEDALEKEKATHFCILAWRIPWTTQSQRVAKSHGRKESDTTERLFHFYCGPGLVGTEIPGDFPQKSQCHEGHQQVDLPGLIF